MTDENKIAPQPEYDALHAFDAENNGARPAREIARLIAMKHDCSRNHPIVDDIAHAIEDAIELGQRRGRLIPTAQPAA